MRVFSRLYYYCPRLFTFELLNWTPAAVPGPGYPATSLRSRLGSGSGIEPSSVRPERRRADLVCVCADPLRLSLDCAELPPPPPPLAVVAADVVFSQSGVVLRRKLCMNWLTIVTAGSFFG